MKKQSKLMQNILNDNNFHDWLDGSEILRDNYLDFIADKLNIADILREQQFVKNNIYYIADAYEEFLDEDPPDLKPKTRNNYIGIELECFSEYSRSELRAKITKLGLDKMVQPVGDGSINADFGEDCELRILLPEKQLVSGLKKLSKLLTKREFGVNESCGLHIHLDMRNRDVEACYKQLLKFQDVLFGMVDQERRSNSYCRYNTSSNAGARHIAINKECAYRQHKTIEVRLHQSTLDMKRIEQWVKLLLNVIGSKASPPKASREAVIEWGKKQRGLGQYISKNFDESWFKQKPTVLGGT